MLLEPYSELVRMLRFVAVAGAFSVVLSYDGAWPSTFWCMPRFIDSVFPVLIAARFPLLGRANAAERMTVVAALPHENLEVVESEINDRSNPKRYTGVAFSAASGSILC